ncbi:MAG: hypothetical protein ABIA93_06770 [Candidatus Woesearchaeota archaeon]
MCVGCSVQNAERLAEKGINVGDMGAYITRQVSATTESTYGSIRSTPGLVYWK